METETDKMTTVPNDINVPVQYELSFFIGHGLCQCEHSLNHVHRLFSNQKTILSAPDEELHLCNRHLDTTLRDDNIRSRIFTDFSSSVFYTGKLYVQLLEMLTFYAGFEINEQTGEALTDHEMTDIHYNRITSLQKAAFKHFPELHNFALANVASIGMFNFCI